MTVYLDLVMALNFLVDFLLLVGTNRLCGLPWRFGRAAAAAALGGLYGGMCLLPGFRFLGRLPWRLAALAGMAVIAYGFCRDALSRGLLFVLLSLALGGAASLMASGGAASLVGCALGLALLCAAAFRSRRPAGELVEAELCYGANRVKATALRDTGNTLRDPLTGQPVLVAGADVARKLTGLTPWQLSHPVETMESAPVPGLRLVPYRAVGSPEGLLLAVACRQVKLGTWQGSLVVALAPNRIDGGGTYQLLMGGTIG